MNAGALRTTAQMRREALGHDVLLFCAAFTSGALVYFIGRTIQQSATDGVYGDFWSVSLSADLILSGLLAGELFVLWNNGLRQGVRGHSIGKHRVGLAVVGVRDNAPTGIARGLLRGCVMVVLLDLAAAAIPIGLPTALRRLTPEAWHIGGFAYLALVLLLVPLVLATDRGLADAIAGTRVIQAMGQGAVTAPRRRRVLAVIDVLGIAGLVAIALTYIVYAAPLLLFPELF